MDYLKNQNGGPAIEFAIIMPILTVMLMGILAYGGCFWTSHSLQQLVNDSARAAVGGLSSSERSSLAQATMTTEIQDYPNLNPAMANLSESEAGQSMTVAVTYDASGSIFWAFADLVPMPSPQVVRQATVQLGGY